MTAAILVLLLTASPCEDLRPEAGHVAARAGLDTETILRLAWHESRCRAIEGCCADVTGVGQVSWLWWWHVLLGAGWGEHDLLDARWSLLMAGEVLAWLRMRYGIEGDRLLCAYNGGPRKLAELRRRGLRSCRYARMVRKGR